MHIYLQKNNPSLLGLQALHEGPSTEMVEVAIKSSDTAMLSASEAKHAPAYQITGWTISEKYSST